MTTRTKDLDNVQSYDGSLLSLNSTLIASSFSDTSGGTLTYEDADNERDWDGSEEATYNGSEATYIGSGTVTAGVSILGLTISLGSSVDVTVWEADGTTYLYYPDGDQASLLDGLVTSLLSNRLTSYLGVTYLTNYVEENALLTFSLSSSSSLQFPVCFTAGTLIDTIFGPKPVETLCEGDLVQTADNGYQPIVWIGHRRVAAQNRFAPIHFREGSLGNAQAIEVSPQHRMLVTGWQAELLFGEPEVLVAATHLQNDRTIYRRQGGMVDYYHLLFSNHEIISGNGVLSESFHTGETGLATLQSAQREEVMHLFPELTTFEPPPLARQSLKSFQGKVLADYLDA